MHYHIQFSNPKKEHVNCLWLFVEDEFVQIVLTFGHNYRCTKIARVPPSQLREIYQFLGKTFGYLVKQGGDGLLVFGIHTWEVGSHHTHNPWLNTKKLGYQQSCL